MSARRMRRKKRKLRTAVSFFLLLLGTSLLQANRPLTSEDLLVLILDGLWDGKGMTAGIGDTADGALKVGSVMLTVATT